MARPPKISPREITTKLRASSLPLSARELGALLGVNRATIVRTLGAVSGEVVTLGGRTSARYLLRLELSALGNHWDIFSMDASTSASPRRWARLESLHPNRWRVVWEIGTEPAWTNHFTDKNGLWNGFPWFLADVRPQGFLGRQIGKQVGRLLGVPEDARTWGDEETLRYLFQCGEDLPGALVVGEANLKKALQVAEATSEPDYGNLASLAVQAAFGSSAGGEQPKFLAKREDGTSVLVKFSPVRDSAVAQRVADLLACEFLALQVLAEQGLALPGCQLLDVAGRRFLEVPRFDRIGHLGRRNVVSLLALSGAALGLVDGGWTTAVAELTEMGLVSAADLETVRRLSAFGEMIGNSDMHFGNLAFFFDDGPHFRLTPTYDMLPMLWMPTVQGELISRPLPLGLPVPAQREAWGVALVWAKDFWARVANSTLISPDFQQIAAESPRLLQLVNPAGLMS